VRGSVRRTPADAMSVARLALPWLIGACLAANGLPSSAADRLTRGTLAGADARTGAAAAASGPGVDLPYVVPEPDAARGSVVLRLEWPLPEVGDRTYAVYVTATTMPTRVYVNGHLVGATGPLAGPRPRSYEQSQAFDVAPTLLRAGANEVVLMGNAAAAGPVPAAFGEVLAGLEPEIRRRAMRDLAVYTVAPAFIAVTTTVVGVFILALWARRREAGYAMFGVASILWGLHTGVSLLPYEVLPSPHYGIAWNAVYMAFVVMLSLFCVRFTGHASKAFERAGTAFVLLVAPLLYVAHFAGVLGVAAVAVRAGGIVFVLAALAAVVRHAMRRRDVVSVLFLVTGGVSAAFAIHDWLAAQQALAVRPVWLVPYAALFFLTLVGWILVDRFVQARNEAEALNRDLERRVDDKSAQLSAQLARTDEARREALVAQRRAELADQSKSRFLAAASHDLRQPLHALGLFAAALRERRHDPETTALVGRINTSVESLEALFSALLDISRLDAGVVVAQPRDVALQPLLERIANDFSAEAVDRSLRLSVVPTRFAVRTDPVLLERILRNLVANALHYTDAGGVVVGARRRGGDVAIEVWDSGRGIAAQDRERVFEEFWQAGNPERDRTRGLGLGLAIVRRLADLLGHAIVLDSRPGRGSVFRVVLPRVAAIGAQRGPAHSGVSPTALEGARVLVLDDDAEAREGMASVLAAWRCTVVAVGDPSDLAADAAPPDALLVDYRLRGGLDGMHAIGVLRGRFGAGVPAIVVTGESLPAELARIVGSGLPMLHKPVQASKLRAALLYALSRRAGNIA